MSNPVLQPGDRFLRMRDVCELVGLSPARVYQLVAEGAFPHGHVLGPHYTRWLTSEVHAWMQQRLDASRPSSLRRSA